MTTAWTPVVDWSMRWLPLIVAVAYVVGLFGCRAILHLRTYGRSALHVPRSDDVSAQAFVTRMLPLFFLALLIFGGLAAFSPDLLGRLDPLYARRSPGLILAGALITLAAALWVWRVQGEMAASWRVGIDESERTELVTGGLFRFCRNPIYLGLQVGLMGFGCLVPGYLTFDLLVVAAVLFQVQARLEEGYLLSKHSEVYARYCREVGRFLPWTGRWAPVRQPANDEPPHRD
jgi:protein-S-isoprenylcysteine O-methyltransferase Ste14